jgi:hypothetical protein
MTCPSSDPGETTDTGPPAALDPVLLCYCTSLTIGALREACLAGRWPLPGLERTGKLCTGCAGDLLYCLRAFGRRER